MHYMNGRAAKVGDKIVGVNGNEAIAGIVVETQAGSDTCNLYIVPTTSPKYIATAKQCLHIDDLPTSAKPV